MYALRMSDVNKEATYLLTYLPLVWP